MAKRWYYKDENGNKVPVPQYKINADDYYTKTISDSRYYEKSATDTLLDSKVSKSDIVQSTGTSTTAVMSQKAVSDAIAVEETRAKKAEENLVGKVTELETEVISKIEICSFDGNLQSVATLNHNIVLEKDGDSLEFEVVECRVEDSDFKRYSFAKNPINDSKIGIGISKGELSFRSDNSTWVASYKPIITSGYIFKIAYESGVTNIYRGSELIYTYSGQEKITLSSFGDGSTYGNWSGTVKNIKINGSKLYLTNSAVLSNVDVLTETNSIKDDVKNIIHEVSEINSTLSKQIPKEKIEINSFEDVITTTAINQSSHIFSYEGSYYIGSIGEKIPLQNYKWLQFIVPNDMLIWANSYDKSIGYDYMIGIYNNGTATEENFVAPRLRDNGSYNTLPTQETPLHLSKGQLFVIAYYARNGSETFELGVEGIQGNKTFIDTVKLNNKQIEQVRKSINTQIAVLVKQDEYTIQLNGYDITLKKVLDTTQRANLWNITSVTKNGTLFLAAGTDIVGVLQEVGQSDFMGGIHGDETIVDFHILADGKAITEDTMCKQVDVLMYSHLTRVSTGENIIDRFIHIVFRDNYIEIDNTFKCLVDNFNLNYAYNGGMWAWHCPEAQFEMCNVAVFNSDESPAGNVITPNKNIYSTQAILSNGSINVENLIGNQYPNYMGEVFKYEDNNRCKIYYGTDRNSKWQTGHICYGKARYTLM